MKKVSVVIPMYYEEEVANECYTRMKKVLGDLKNYEHELIFVNDGSKDKTLPILEEIAKKDNNVKVISFSRNFGHQAAVTAGLKKVTVERMATSANFVQLHNHTHYSLLDGASKIPDRKSVV